MLLEDTLDLVYVLGISLSFIALGISLRIIIPPLSVDDNHQKTEQEEVDIEDKILSWPENVIPFDKMPSKEPFKEFVEEFLFFETVRKHKDMIDFAVKRTDMVRKANRLLKK